MNEKNYTAIGETTSLWRDYENGRAYQSATGLAKNIPKFVKFYEGDQWPPVTKNTKNLPRPVINVINMISQVKLTIRKVNLVNYYKDFPRFAVFQKTLKNNLKKICSG